MAAVTPLASFPADSSDPTSNGAFHVTTKKFSVTVAVSAGFVGRVGLAVYTSDSTWEPVRMISAGVGLGVDGVVRVELDTEVPPSYYHIWLENALSGQVSAWIREIPNAIPVLVPITTAAPLSGDGSVGTPATIAAAAKNTTLAGPVSGADAVPTFRALTGADVNPALDFKMLRVYGLAAPGSIVFPGAVLGMRILSIAGLDVSASPPTATNFVVATDFEPTGLISVDGHLKQTTVVDLHQAALDILLVPAT